MNPCPIPMPFILCACCNKHVDTIEWYDEPSTGSRVIIVQCHGMTEQVELTHAFIELCSHSEQIRGVAFTQQIISDSQK